MRKLVLFISLLFIIPTITKADSIAINSDQSFFGITIGGETWDGNNYFNVSGNSERALRVHLYNYEGISRPWTYLMVSGCAANGYAARSYITNANHNANYFDETQFIAYDTNPSATCTTPDGKTGRIFYMQFRVGLYEDYDDTGEELYVTSTLNLVNPLSYNVTYHFYTWYLSDNDLLTQLQKDSQLLNAYNQLTQQSINNTQDIINNQNSNTNNIINNQDANTDKITGALDDTTDAIDGVNDSITNSNTDNPSSKFEEFENMLPENGVITDLITLPISLFQNVLNSINGTCNEYNLGNLLGTDLKLPCINISNYIGSTLWNVIDILFSGLFVLVIGKKMIKAFNSFTSMEEGDVLD